MFEAVSQIIYDVSNYFISVHVRYVHVVLCMLYLFFSKLLF